MTIDWELVSDEVARNVSADDLDKTEVDSELLDVDGQPIKATRYKYAWTPPDVHLNGINIIPSY